MTSTQSQNLVQGFHHFHFLITSSSKTKHVFDCLDSLDSMFCLLYVQYTMRPYQPSNQ